MSPKQLDADYDSVLDEDIVASGAPTTSTFVGFDGSKSVWKQIYAFQAAAPADTTILWLQDIRV